MNLLKLVIGGAAAAAIVLAFRDLRNGRWLTPPLPRRGPELAAETEPILGYDGMDQETLLGWLDAADLDPTTLRRIRRYEEAHRAREDVLGVLDSLL